MRNILFSAIFVVAGMAPALAADDLASKMVNDPSVGWAPMGPGAKAELIKDATVQGGGAVRLTISGKGANPWDSGAQVAITKPLAQGDVLLLAFWAKAVQAPAGGTAITFNANMQKVSAPYNWIGNATVNVGPQWKMYFVQAVADKDYKPKDISAQLHLAIDPLVIDLGPLFILNYGKDYDRTKLPKN